VHAIGVEDFDALGVDVEGGVVDVVGWVDWVMGGFRHACGGFFDVLYCCSGVVEAVKEKVFAVQSLKKKEELEKTREEEDGSGGAGDV
jgi:hypothetical protein